MRLPRLSQGARSDCGDYANCIIAMRLLKVLQLLSRRD